jgi:hypothetical protein
MEISLKAKEDNTNKMYLSLMSTQIAAANKLLEFLHPYPQSGIRFPTHGKLSFLK